MALLTSGTRLGPYEILSPLASGGMGEVYRARDTRLAREVAVKVMPSNLAGDETARARFEREARAIASLSHPNILAIFDFDSSGSIWFAVTELLQGETLRVRMASGPLPWRTAVELAVAIADGLAAAHGKGIIHRDLKPENVFLTDDRRVKILDFGIARRLPGSSPDEDTSISPPARTEPGTIIGTIAYMSPEQLRGEEAGPTSDIFSLGCVLHEMLTGTRPFARDTAVDTMAAILRENAPPLDSRTLPFEMIEIVERCLAKRPSERFQSTRDLALTLRAILTASGPSAILALPKEKKRRRRKIDALAVLPFVNGSEDAASEYLSDGITESLIQSLSRLPKLRVMARSTVFRYKGRELDPQRTGRELGVRAVVTGKIVHFGDTLVVTTELVDADDGSQLWGEQYARELSDVLTLQRDIASEIAEQLRIRVSGEEKQRIVRRETESGEAYRLYLKGRFHWNRRTLEGIRKGIDYFERALARDATFALAWTGLADSYLTLATNIPLPPAETMPKAKQAAARAIEIDETLAEAHAAWASVVWWHEWDAVTAEAAFARANALNPNDATACDQYGQMLAALGRFEDASRLFARALETDPLGLIVNVHAGWPDFFAGRYDQAIEHFSRTLEMDEDFLPARGWLALAYEQTGDHVAAMGEIERALAVNDVPIFRAMLAHACALAGRTAEARSLASALVDLSSRKYVSPYDLAVVNTALGERDQAIEWLHRAAGDRSPWMVFLPLDPRLAPLHDDPRFEALAERTGLLRPRSLPT